MLEPTLDRHNSKSSVMSRQGAEEEEIIINLIPYRSKKNPN